MEDERLQELIERLEKEINREKGLISYETDMRYYHLGYADALQSIKGTLEGVRNVQS